MWMMGYSDAAAEFTVSDSFNGRKLRPLIPRPLPSSPNPNPRLLPTDFFSLNHHHHLGSHFVDQNKREFNAPPVVVSSRWNPTPEQLRTLEELYRRGTRTPSAEQIQHITAQLRRYGKIEGKNVFYWFQNHKARERQKRRRQMELSSPSPDDIEIFPRKDSSTGANRTTTTATVPPVTYELDHNKIIINNNWLHPTNCTTTTTAPPPPLSLPLQECGGMQIRARKAEGGGWIQLDEGELQNGSTTRNATWQNMMQLSCPSHITNLTPTSTSPSSTVTTTLTTLDPKQLNHNTNKTNLHDLNIYIPPYKENINGQGLNHHSQQTLQLFPLTSEGDDEDEDEDCNEQDNFDKPNLLSISCHDDNLMTPNQFFEFLPLKN